MIHPQLKPVSVLAPHGRVLVYVRPYERIELDDPDGGVAQLLVLLAQGTRTTGELAGALRVAGHPTLDSEVAAAVDTLGGMGLLHEAEDWSTLPRAVVDRHESNLHYYDLFSTPSRTAADIHAAAARGRVLLLGAGGVGSSILQALVGAGVAFVRIVDIDTVETKNLARQFCYGPAAIGRHKADAAAGWVQGYSPETEVEPLIENVESPVRIEQLAADVDVVVCAIDTPTDAQLLVNRACMNLGTPFVTGGLQQSALYYWSVEPGVSPCRNCLELHRAAQLSAAEAALREPAIVLPSNVNRATGAVVQLLGGLMALETLRYVSRHDEPVARATYHWISLVDGMLTDRDSWASHPDCPDCARRTASLEPSPGSETDA